MYQLDYEYIEIPFPHICIKALKDAITLLTFYSNETIQTLFHQDQCFLY